MSSMPHNNLGLCWEEGDLKVSGLFIHTEADGNCTLAKVALYTRIIYQSVAILSGNKIPVEIHGARRDDVSIRS